MKKILSLFLGLLWAVPVLAQENYLSALSLSGTFVTGAEKPYKIPVRVSNGETSQTGYIYADAPVYKLSNYADVVDFQTGKITRNIKKDVFTGAEAWGYSGYAPGKLFIFNNDAKKELVLGASNYYQFVNNISAYMPDKSFSIQGYSTTQNGIFLNDKSYTSAAAWKAHLTELYNAGRPLEIYVVTNTPTVEEINLSTLPQMSGNVTYQVIFPEPQITIATTKYNETKFGPLNTALANAISVVDTVVSNTITQAASIATLQAQKQTRPNDIADDNEKCPAGKKCLLVEDASGVPHWYEIVENAYGLPSGYTALEYIQSDGASYLIVPYRVNNKTVFYCRYNEIQNGPQDANAVFGVTTSPSSSQANNGILRLTGSRFNRMGWGDSVSNSVIDVNAPKVFNTWYEVLYDQNKLYQNGSLYATSATEPSTSWVAEYDLGVFARNSESVTMPAIAKISSVWAKENGEYKINLIPVKRNSDGVLGMYDTVSGEFFTNKGSGSFIAGDPVSE